MNATAAMIWIEHFNDARGWLAWLASANAQAAVLIVAALALRAAMGRWLTPGWRGLIWLLIGLRLLVPLAIESRYSLAALGRQVASLRPTASPSPAPTPSRATPEGPSVSVTYGPIPDAAEPAIAPPRATTAAPPAGPARTLVAIWLGVSALLLARQLVGAVALRRSIRRMRPVDDAATLALLARCAADVGVRQPVRIVETDRLRAPAICGILRPTILLPAGATHAFSPADLRLMLMHELVHVRRDDVLVAALYRGVVALHWFNPLVWLAAAAFRDDRELACDAAVLRLLGDDDRRAYGECIVRVIEHVARLRPHPSTLGLFGTTRRLRQRIDLIAHAAGRRPRVVPATIGAVASAALGVAVATGDPAAATNPYGPGTRPATSTEFDADSPEARDAAAAALFERRLAGPFEFSGTPLIQAINQLVVAAESKVRFDSSGIERAGVAHGTPVTASLRNVSLGKALSIVCAAAADGGREPLDFEADDGKVFVSSRSAIAERFARTRTFPLGSNFDGILADGKPTPAGRQLLRAVTGLNDRDSWQLYGSGPGTIEITEAGLVARHTPRRLGGVVKALANLYGLNSLVAQTGTTAPSDPARATEAIEMKLGVALEPQGTPFAAVIEQLRHTAGAPMFVNWTAIENAGVSRDEPLTFMLPADVKFGKALEITLDAAGGGMARLGFNADDGVITVSTRDDLVKNVATRTYDIRDLLVNVPDFVPPGGNLLGPNDRSPVDKATSQKNQTDREQLVARIIDLVQDAIERDSWRRHGGTIGQIQELGGQLIVTNTPAVHEQVAALLRQLRECRAMQVNVEARILAIDIDHLPPTFNRLVQGADRVDPKSFNAFLTTEQLREFLKEIAGSRHAQTLTAPRLTLFNGQQAYVKVAMPHEYIKSYTLTRGAGEERRYEPVMEKVESGVTTSIQATLSADRASVTMTVHPVSTTLLRMDSAPFPMAGDGKADLAIQRPILDVQEIQTTVTVPDRGTALLSAGGIGGKDGRQLIVVLLTPTAIIPQEIAEPASQPIIEHAP